MERCKSEVWEGPKPEASTVLSLWNQGTLFIQDIYAWHYAGYCPPQKLAKVLVFTVFISLIKQAQLI